MPGEEPPVRGRYRFSQDQRLKQAWEFERTRQEGNRLVKGCLILNWRLSAEQTKSRLGVVTSKKIGNAVIRARARRLLREVFRKHQHDLAPADIVLIARNSIAGRSCDEVERDFVAAAKSGKLMGARTT